MPRISRPFITQRLLPAVPIEDLIGRYVTLKRSGSNLVACCPFHHEKTPSFTVTPSKQMFYCFGCKEHGNAIDFLMKFKNLDFVQAVEELAESAGLGIEYEDGRSPRSDRFVLYYELMDRAAAAYSRALESAPQAQDYFLKKRGLTRDTVVKCRLGYAPDSWDFIKKIARNADEEKALETVGLVLNKGSGNSYDFFRNRVIIPIIDRRGRIVSFGGRCLGDEKPKYINTAETPIYHKRQELFGLYQALQENRNRPQRLVVVEGYMDVISLQQAGINYAVASLGTATTAEQFKTMFRYSKQVVCCYDGDQAGRMAAWHALETVTHVLEAGQEIRFAFLPPEHDPDSLVREQGQSGMLRVLDGAVSYPEFLIDHVRQSYDLSDLGQRSSFINAALHQARLISYQPLQAMVLERLSQQVNIETERLFRMLDEVQLSRQEMQLAAQAEQQARPVGEDGRRFVNNPMRRLIAFILQQPTVTAVVYDAFQLDTLAALLTALKAKGAEDVIFLLQCIREDKALTPGRLIEIIRGTPREKYCRLLIDAEFIPKRPDGSEFSLEDRAELLAKYITEVLTDAVRHFIENLKFNQGALLGRTEQQMMTELNRLLQYTR